MVIVYVDKKDFIIKKKIPKYAKKRYSSKYKTSYTISSTNKLLVKAKKGSILRYGR